MQLDKLKSTVQDLVAANDLDTALALMQKELSKDSKAYNMVVSISSDLSDLKQSLIIGTMNFEKNQDLRSTIRSKMLNIFDLLGPGDLTGYQPPGEKSEPADKEKEKIRVFLSIATPFNAQQKKFVEHFQKKFEAHGMELVRARWSSENPLLPVRDLLKEVSGCVVLALERMKSTESIYKEGSDSEQKAKEEYFTTPWIQMEAAMAYQQGLPILIFSDRKVKSEGMIEMGVHEFRVFTIDPQRPEQLDDDHYSELFQSWSEKVGKHHLSISNT